MLDNIKTVIILMLLLTQVSGNISSVSKSAPILKTPPKADSIVTSGDSLYGIKSYPDSSRFEQGEEPREKHNSHAVVDSSWWSRKIDSPAFNLGERLEFSVKYGRLPAGTAVMQILDTVSYDKHLCYRVTSTATSNDVVSIFYPVRDTVETYLDVPGIFPRRFRKHLREGNYRMDRTTVFNQRTHLAITGNDTVPTYAFVQDPLSSLYYIRTQELTPGKDVMIDSHTDKKNYPLKVLVLRKEKVTVPAGTFDCVVIEPVMRSEGIFKAKGRIWIWLTDDEYKMPVMMKSEVYFLGSVSAQLSSFSRGKRRSLNEQTQEN